MKHEYFYKNSKPLMGSESLQPEVKNYIQRFYSMMFDNAKYTVSGFESFEIRKSAYTNDLIVHVTYMLKGSDNSVSKYESIFVKDSEGNLEGYMNMEINLNIPVGEDKTCAEHSTVVECVHDPVCCVDSTEKFGKCKDTLVLGFLPLF